MKNIIFEEFLPCESKTWGCENCTNRQIKHTIGFYEGQAVDSKVGMGKIAFLFHIPHISLELNKTSFLLR